MKFLPIVLEIQITAWCKCERAEEKLSNVDSTRSGFHDLPLFHCAVASVDFSHIALRSKVRIAESGARNVYLFMTYETSKENEGWPTFAADRATSVGGGISGHAGRIILQPSLLREDLKFWMKNTAQDVAWHRAREEYRMLLSKLSKSSNHKFINFIKCAFRFYL